MKDYKEYKRELNLKKKALKELEKDKDGRYLRFNKRRQNEYNKYTKDHAITKRSGLINS